MYVPIKKKIKYFIGFRNLSEYCHAYYCNLYFRVNGDVTPCFKNSEYVFGHYPKDSIKDIIEGEQRKHFISLFKQKSIPKGCEKCNYQLKHGPFFSADFNIYNNMDGHISFPTNMEFELSNHCNLKCIMCNESLSDKHSVNSGRTQTMYYEKNFAQELKPYIPFLKGASFKGGEPFLIDVYFLIWDQITSLNKNVNISVTSNGTILNQRLIDVLQKGKFHINISIDSLEKEKFEEIRLGASFEVFRKNLKFFIDYSNKNNTFFNSCTCLMNNNYESIPNIFKYADENDFNIHINYVEIPQYLSLKYSDQTTLKNAIKFLINSKPNFKTRISSTKSQTYNSMLKQLKLWLSEK